jgi:hypothetical protein
VSLLPGAPTQAHGPVLLEALEPLGQSLGAVAIESFISHCDVAARDLLLPYGDLVIVLSTLLRIRRTLDGAEIDKIIWDFEAHKASAIERRRRADLRKCEVAASGFRAECEHLDAASTPHRIGWWSRIGGFGGCTRT